MDILNNQMRWSRVFAVLVLAASVGAAAQTKQPQPSLKDTLEWIQNTLDDNGNEYINDEVRSVRLTSFSECQVHFTYTKTRNGRNTRMDESFSLADIDPGYVLFHQFPKNHVREGFGIFTAGVQNDAKKINLQTSWGDADSTENGIVFEMQADYGVRFTKAFKHAVNLCGGKSSILAFDPQPARQPAATAEQPAPGATFGTPTPLKAFAQPKQSSAKASLTPSRKDIPTIGVS